MSKARLVIAAVITGGTAPDALRSAVENVRAGLATRAEAVQLSIVIYVMCTTGPNAQQDFNDEIARWGFDPTMTSECAAMPTRLRRAPSDGWMPERTPLCSNRPPTS